MAFALSAGGKKNGVSPTMNVTPLVDVVLVLLIIFMVVTPLLSKHFWIEVPKIEERKEAPPPSDVKNLVVTVDAKGAIAVNKQLVAKGELGARLRELLASREEKIVYFQAAKDAPYADVVSALDETRMGGAATIAVLTTEPKD